MTGQEVGAVVISAVLVLVLWDYMILMQLWLCGLVGLQHTYGTWTLTLITQSSTVRRKGGVFLKAAPIQWDGDNTHDRARGGHNCHQCSIGVSFVGLPEPHATLALWLGWITALLRDMNSDLDHSDIKSKMHNGDSLLEAVPIQQ
jgi:hypothetical protein